MVMALENQALVMQNLNSNTTRQQYNKDGFYVFKGLIDRESLSKIKDDIHYLVTQQLKLVGQLECLPLDDALKLLFSLDIERYLMVVGSVCRLRNINQLFSDESIDQILIGLGINNAMIPTNPVFHIMSEALKVPNGYYGLDAHQDWPSMQGSLDSIIIWIPLVDVTSNLNPLEVVPGSHRIGLVDSVAGKNESVISDSIFSDKDFKAVIVNQQDVVVMSSFTVHRSSMSGGQGIRMACSLRFENIDEAHYIERGYPTAYQRVVHRENMGYVPTTKDVSQIFENNSVSRL